MNKSKKVKTECDEPKREMEGRLLQEKQFFRKIQEKGRTVSIVDLNITSQYFEEWEVLYSKAKQERSLKT